MVATCTEKRSDWQVDQSDRVITEVVNLDETESWGSTQVNKWDNHNIPRITQTSQHTQTTGDNARQEDQGQEDTSHTPAQQPPQDQRPHVERVRINPCVLEETLSVHTEDSSPEVQNKSSSANVQTLAPTRRVETQGSGPSSAGEILADFYHSEDSGSSTGSEYYGSVLADYHATTTTEGKKTH